MRNMEATILLVENDEALAHLLREVLQTRGYQVLLANCGKSGVQLFQRHHPDMILLSITMSGMDGWETCRLIRRMSNVPIILLHTRKKESDKVRGLKLGADDCMTKPLNIEELLARIHALLRRSRYSNEPKRILEVDERLTIDLERQQVYVEGQSVYLSCTEYKLLSCLLQQPDRVCSHERLLDEVWGWEYTGEMGYVKVYIHRLRRKLEANRQQPCYLLTERGRGYYFHVPTQD
jgi:two-component system KDP operon response regulator KdpE